MSKMTAKFLVSLGGIWLTAWIVMLAVGRMHEIWGISTISIGDSMTLVFFGLCAFLGLVISFTVFLND